MEEEKSHSEVSKWKKSNSEKEKLIGNLKKKIIYFENEKLEYLNDRAKLAKLFDLGLIDSSGDPLPYHSDYDQDKWNNERL